MDPDTITDQRSSAPRVNICMTRSHSAVDGTVCSWPEAALGTACGEVKQTDVQRGVQAASLLLGAGHTASQNRALI